MNIFILDDDINRHDFLIKMLGNKYNNTNIVSAQTADEAYKFLKNEKWDMIFLDHDLGGEAYVDSNLPNTGYQVAKFIKNNNIKYDICIIHSMNPVGARNIQSILPDSNLIPIVLFQSKFVE